MRKNTSVKKVRHFAQRICRWMYKKQKTKEYSQNNKIALSEFMIFYVDPIEEFLLHRIMVIMLISKKFQEKKHTLSNIK